MKMRAILAVSTALVLSLSATAQAQAPEYQNPETMVHEVSAPLDPAVAEAFGIAGSDLPFDSEYRIGVLENGLKFVIRPNGTPQGQGMVYLWVNAGSLGEEPDQAGYAHFLEHMAFKGTARRNALQIAEEIEDVGGYINAYTSRETTAYYARVLQEDVGLALDVVGDIVLNPAFHEADIETERHVILQEIGLAGAICRASWPIITRRDR